MKKVLKGIFILLITAILLTIFSTSMYAADEGIMPYATQYIIYQYMEGTTYTTPVFTKGNSTAITVNGSVGGATVSVSVYNADTGKKIGNTIKMKPGETTVYVWDSSLLSNGDRFYYEFTYFNIFTTAVFLNLYVLY